MHACIYKIPFRASQYISFPYYSFYILFYRGFSYRVYLLSHNIASRNIDTMIRTFMRMYFIRSSIEYILHGLSSMISHTALSYFIVPPHQITWLFYIYWLAHRFFTFFKINIIITFLYYNLHFAFLYFHITLFLFPILFIIFFLLLNCAIFSSMSPLSLSLSLFSLSLSLSPASLSLPTTFSLFLSSNI